MIISLPLPIIQQLWLALIAQRPVDFGILGRLNPHFLDRSPIEAER
jgi:hypothetical protein